MDSPQIFDDYLNTWIEKGTIVLLLGDGFSNHKEFVLKLLSNDKVDNILYLNIGTNKQNSIPPGFNSRVIPYLDKKMYVADNVFCIVDFMNTNGTYTDFFDYDVNTREKKNIKYIFNKRSWRDKVSKIIFYGYNGIKPKNAYWVVDNDLNEVYTSFKKSQWADISQTSTDGKSTGLNFVGDNDWNLYFTNYIKNIVSNFVEDPSLFVNDQALQIWAHAFTHKSYDMERNYEKLEFFGDASSKDLFNNYMKKKYPQFNEQEYTEYSNQYLSKNFQSVFADDLKLVSWLIYNPVLQINEKIKTDVFESFIGALRDIGDNIEDGFGLFCCMNFFTILGNSLDFPENMKYGIPLTQVVQINKRYGFSDSYLSGDNTFYSFHDKKDRAFIIREDKKEITDTKNNTVNINNIYEVVFNSKFISQLQKDNFNAKFLQNAFTVRDKTGEYPWIYTQIVNNNEKESKTEAYNAIFERIYNVYQEIGLTQEYVKTIIYHPLQKISNINRELVSNFKKVLLSNFTYDIYNKINFDVDSKIGLVIMYYTDNENKKHNLTTVLLQTAVPKTLYQNITPKEYSLILCLEQYIRG